MEGLLIALLYAATLWLAGGSGVRFPDLDSIIEANPRPAME